MSLDVERLWRWRGKLKAVHRGPAAYGLGASGLYGTESAYQSIYPNYHRSINGWIIEISDMYILPYVTTFNAEDLYVALVRTIDVTESHTINVSTTHSARRQTLSNVHILKNGWPRWRIKHTQTEIEYQSVIWKLLQKYFLVWIFSISLK
jgi:hypothetical protein